MWLSRLRTGRCWRHQGQPAPCLHIRTAPALACRGTVEAAVSLLFLKLRLHTPCRVASETQKHDLTAIPLHHTTKKPGRGFMERCEMSRAMGALTAGQKVQRFSTMQTPARRSLRCACHFLKRLHAACFTAGGFTVHACCFRRVSAEGSDLEAFNSTLWFITTPGVQKPMQLRTMLKEEPDSNKTGGQGCI